MLTLGHVVIGSLLLLSWLWLSLLWLRHPGIGRPSRRPGYIQLSLNAYGYGSPTTAPTRTRTETSTECKQDGQRPEGTDSPGLRAALSRTTAPGLSGNATASARGDHTTAAEPGMSYSHEAYYRDGIDAEPECDCDPRGDAA